MYFVDESKKSKKSIAPGIDITVVSGDKAQMSFVTLMPGSKLPIHEHPHEQMGVVLEGEYDMVIGGERRTLREGDTYVIPSGVLHSVPEVHKPSRALDVFGPPREEYR